MVKRNKFPLEMDQWALENWCNFCGRKVNPEEFKKIGEAKVCWLCFENNKRLIMK